LHLKSKANNKED